MVAVVVGNQGSGSLGSDQRVVADIGTDTEGTAAGRTALSADVGIAEWMDSTAGSRVDHFHTGERTAGWACLGQLNDLEAGYCLGSYSEGPDDWFYHSCRSDGDPFGTL